MGEGLSEKTLSSTPLYSPSPSSHTGVGGPIVGPASPLMNLEAVNKPATWCLTPTAGPSRPDCVPSRPSANQRGGGRREGGEGWMLEGEVKEMFSGGCRHCHSRPCRSQRTFPQKSTGVQHCHCVDNEQACLEQVVDGKAHLLEQARTGEGPQPLTHRKRMITR